MNRFHRWFCRSRFWKKAVMEGLPWVLEGVDLGEKLLEVGPGPGLTTDFLGRTGRRVTSLEIDARLAATLQARLRDSNVTVVRGDGTRLPFLDRSFSGAVCFTMLHHVPSPSLQDRLLAEVRRVLRPGGIFAGSDSVWSPAFGLIHLFDTMVVVDPKYFPDRLKTAGFEDVVVETMGTAFRFRARRPVCGSP